ncbi:MAG: Maf family protein [Thalassobaculales bacterium]
MPDSQPELILASGSAIRRSLLEGAGVPFSVAVAAVDEGTVRDSLHQAGADAADCAVALAELKALRISRQHPNALVVGCDQILDCDGRWYEKPADAAGARETLISLRNRTHRLISAACLVRGGQVLWHHAETCRMTMRDFSDPFLDRYLEQCGDAILASVGCYQLEGIGVQLFRQIDGDYFAILGLPLLPLLDMLRQHGVVAG